MADVINVTAPGGGYPIVIEHGLLRRMRDFVLSGRSIIVTNPILLAVYADQLTESLPAAAIAQILDGERYKTLNTVEMLYNDFLVAGLDRSSDVIAFGGGIVGDVAGFAAATFMRGIRFVQIPTTLLAMVDSSVGGKVGVDLYQGKNLVGAFKQPDAVLIDPDVLASLPIQQWRCGMAEILKHGLLADESLLDPALHTLDRAQELVCRAVRVKVDYVQRDPYEEGIRAHLNLGHTFGHAIEQVSGYRWLHGEAVGVGLLAAARVSRVLGLCDPALPERVAELILSVGLPARTNGLDPDAIYAAMSTDKKWSGGKSRFVLLRGIGQPTIVENVPRADVVRVLSELM